MRNFILFGLLTCSLSVAAQQTATTQPATTQPPINPSLLTGYWPAFWIICPGASQRDYGVYHFRKTFGLAHKPEKFIIHVSADSRYRLFVNGYPVCSGPAMSDLANWYFETLDIASYLRPGDNTLAAEVWNMGIWGSVAQISSQTAFVLQGDGVAEEAVNTDRGWKTIKDSAFSPCSMDNRRRTQAYIATGPGDEINGAFYPWGWEQPEYDDRAWKVPGLLANAAVNGSGTDNTWTLSPRNIPLMEESLQRIPLVRRCEDAPEGTPESAPESPPKSPDASPDSIAIQALLTGKHPLTIPAHSTVSILLDQTYNTVAYPELTVSGGRNAFIRLSYAEALQKFGQKGNRNDVKGKTLVGNYDIFHPDGGAHRLFRPLWFRSYRYIQVDLSTGDDPIVIDDFHGMYTGYPFRRNASFASNDSSLQNIWDVGWRTARLCAGETYFGCPYYEQLQYEADARIQSLISLYVSGDDRLMRKAMLDFYHSRVAEGLTQGRYPSTRLQVIPPFSLLWVSMIYDYWMHRKDDAFVEQFLPAAGVILNWFQAHIDIDRNMLGPMQWWGFVDLADAFGNGVPDGVNDGHSSIVTLQYVYTLKQAAQLFDYFGRLTKKENPQYLFAAQQYRDLADSLATHTYQACFDGRKEEMANTPEKTTFSQHAGIMAVLAGAIPPAEEKQVMRKLLYDTTLEQATLYYRFYLTQALKQVGMGDLYYSQLTPWRNMLKTGLTTFAEKPEPTRSDCHGWSASPEYDFLATICGIMPDAPGFSRVLIEPALGGLHEVRASMPHPDGMIIVHFKRENQNLEGEITLPEKLTGRLVYGGKQIALHGGAQTIRL